MSGATWSARLRRRLQVFALALLGTLSGLLPQTARADAVKDALNLASSFAPIVDSYIAPASLTWLPSLYGALSLPTCSNLTNDAAVANCAGALLDSEGANVFGNSSDVAAIASILEIYVDVRSSDWGELFNDIFRLAAAGDPLDVACKILALVTGGFPICGVLELLYDIGKYALQAAEAIVSAFSINDWGESEAMPLPEYFNRHYLPHVERYAQNMRQNWNYWSTGLPELVNPCVSYLSNHRWNKDNAREKCQNGMFDGRQASTEHRFIDKGFLQLVSARYAMLELPRVIDQRFAAMSAGINASAPGLRTRLFGVWGLDGSGKTVLDAQSLGGWPDGSVGAVAMARLRLYIARFGDGEPVMKQKLQEAVDYALANAPDWKRWQQIAAAAAGVPCTARDNGSFGCTRWEEVRICNAQYGKPLAALPRAVGSKTLPTPLCLPEDVGAANRLALQQVNKTLRSELQLHDCSYDIVRHPQVIECVAGSKSALQCSQLLKSGYGEFGLPNDGASCTGLTATLAPASTVVTPPAGGWQTGRELPPSVVPGTGPAVAPSPQVPAPRRERPARADAAVTPPAEAPLCAPTATRGVMQCPTQASMAGCERARQLGQVRQCLPPARR